MLQSIEVIHLKQTLPKIETWPADDQQRLVEAARSIEAERSGAYDASPDELAAIDLGLDDVRQGPSFAERRGQSHPER